MLSHRTSHGLVPNQLLVPSVVFLALVTPLSLAAQQPSSPAREGGGGRSGRGGREVAAAGLAPDSVRYVRAPAYLRGLRWRLVGPFRGGRAVAVAGDPTDQRVFYFGAVNGGVWKSRNGGGSWENISDGRSTISSVGAIALAPSDPNVIYVGGGEADWREDLTYGDGVYRSTDAGETWTHLGLAQAQHIARIVVDPRDPDRAYVAAMGHAFGPNATRGVFRTTDGGKGWQKVLFLDDSTGAIDLAMDPANPRILYAAMWRMQRLPWGFIGGGGRSGLWKSLDGGDTWSELTFNTGMPDSPVGRIGVSVSPANPRRVYAVIECPPEDSTGGVYRSDDAGRTWQRVNSDQKFMVRPWYYSVITADPGDEHAVYVMNLSTWRSVDDGKTFTELRVPHGDTHVLWIDPRDPRRMISGNDGGATVSYDAGASWSSLMNQPTAQFYHVTTDAQFPYRIYAAQQDNTTVSIASRSDNGAISTGDWYPVGGGESAYIAPKPGDPSIVIAGTYTGTMTRYDVRTKQRKDISVWLNNYDGWPASEVPNRFQWTYPILYSRHDSTVLYAAANRVFRSTNDGDSWEVVSPDLTRHDPRTLGPVGGPITRDMTGTEWYATIFALAESPVGAGIFWAGSDDGLVHVTRDGGRTWQNVTPRDMQPFTRVSIIEPSHYEAGTAYLAANRYQLDDFRPYLWKTTDYGRTWRRIDAGIPVGAYTRAVREDPVRRGLLFAGTETGVYFSTDDGAHWQPLQLNLPRCSVRDLHIHGSDLIAATHGRAIWVLDDLTALRQMSDAARAAAAYLFVPDTAIRFGGGGGNREAGAGENPPSGVIVDYWLGPHPTGPVTLDFVDGAGRVVRSFSSERPQDTAAVLAVGAGSDSTRADSVGGRVADRTVQPRDTLARKPRGLRPLADDTLAFTPADSVVPMRAGLNRFVWNLRYASTREVKNVINDEGTTLGPVAVPGAYRVRLGIGGRTMTQSFVVREDPRVKVSQGDLDAQLALALAVQGKTNELSDAVGRIVDIERQLDARTREAVGRPYGGRIAAVVRPLRARLEAVRDSLVEVHAHADEITLHYPIRLYNMLLSLADMVQSADGAPTKQEADIYRDLAAKVDIQLARLRGIERGDLAALNRLMRELEVPAVTAAAAPGTKP
jgi:photosystem II stability/assembly factor-like uncharacterized protein